MDREVRGDPLMVVRKSTTDSSETVTFRSDMYLMKDATEQLYAAFPERFIFSKVTKSESVGPDPVDVCVSEDLSGNI